MIHRDLCDPTNTKYYSPLRMQFHFLLSRFVCWDGSIPLTHKEMAKLLKCDVQSIYKFVKKGVRDYTLKLEGKTIYLLKHVNDFRIGYVKHYPFLESPEFRKLKVHTQRFVLYALWYGVHSGRPFKRPITAFYHSTGEQQSVLNIYSKSHVYPVLEEAKEILDLEVCLEQNGEMVRIHGLQPKYAEQEALHNVGEQKLLDGVLAQYYCDDLVSEQGREAILKLKKYCIDKFSSFGSELFSRALEKLLTLHKVHDLDFNQQVGIYLKAIIDDLEQQLLPMVEKCIYNTQKALTQTKKFRSIPESHSWIRHFEEQLHQLAEIGKVIFNHSRLKIST